MAPRTRRSTGVANALAAAAALDELEAAEQLRQKSISAPTRRRGRPPKNQTLTTVTGSSDSTSSVPTPLTTSDGEYSTPATSNAVTPAPPSKNTIHIPVSAPESSNRPRRGRLTLELPELPPDDDDNDDDDDDDDDSGKKKAKSVSLSTVIRTKRARQSVPSYNEESDEYDGLYGDDQSASAALARKLQREEDTKASILNARVPIKRRNRALSLDSDSESSSIIAPIARTKPKRLSSKSRFPPSHKAPGGRVDSIDAHTLPPRKRQKINETTSAPTSTMNIDIDDDIEIDDEGLSSSLDKGSDESEEVNEDLDTSESDSDDGAGHGVPTRVMVAPPPFLRRRQTGRRTKNDRLRLESNHPELRTMWQDLENTAELNAGMAAQPAMISLQLKPFQLQGLAWMKAMEQTPWRGGLLGDEMGLGKTIQAVSLIMSDYPAKIPTLVLLPPVALGQWQDEIATYTGNKLKTIVFHGTNTKAKNLSVKQLKQFDVIIMSYNSLESLYRKQEKGIKRKDVLVKEKSVMHQIKFHRVILDEAHCIKVS